MKKLQLIFVAFLLVFASCDDETTEYGETIFASADPFIQLLTEKISFVAGEPTYNVSFVVIPGSSDATSVNVYKAFTDAATQETSDAVLLGNFDIDESMTSFTVSTDVDFAQLRDGILIGGNPITTDENEVAIGSKWILSLEPVNGSGVASFETPKNIEVAVLSAFAGNYIVYESSYFRGGADEDLAWNGVERFIGSVNDTTFSHPEFFGRFGFADPTEQFIFYLDKTDNTILIPATVGGESQPISFGEYFISCEDTGDAGDMSNANCDNSNVLIPDFATGKHIFKLSYGYYASIGTGVIGSREFYEAMEKIVE